MQLIRSLNLTAWQNLNVVSKSQMLWRCTWIAVPVLLSACGSTPLKSPSQTTTPAPVAQSKPKQPSLPVLPAAGSGRGAYYQDDGPGDSPPDGLYEVPDAEPKVEKYARGSNKPYVVFGKTYTPFTDERPFVQRGVGSWYGRKFHGQRTSSGERYDMYKMTAAHPTLPIPSYARVSNLINGKQVIVRVNDRGPFHAGRVIDLSYTAALKLGLLSKGSHEVEVERLLPDEIARINAGKHSDSAVVTTVPVANPSSPTSPTSPASAVAQGLRQSDQAQKSILPEPDSKAMDALSVKLAANAPPALRLEQNLNPIGPVSVSTSPVLRPQVTPQATPAEMPNLASNVVNESGTGGQNNASGNFYLQLGAFSLRDNAQAERLKLAQTPLPSLEVVQDGSLFRLFSGPFASRAAAQEAAQSLSGNRALIVQR